MTDEQQTELVNQAIEAVMSPPIKEGSECTGVGYFPPCGVVQMLSALAINCKGALGELAEGIRDAVERKIQEDHEELNRFRELYFATSNLADTLSDQRCALVMELLKSREQTDTVRKNWSATLAKSHATRDELAAENARLSNELTSWKLTTIDFGGL